MDSRTKQIAESFGCEYTLFEKGSEPWEVEEAYMEALKEGEKGGFWPAVLLVDAYVEEWLEIVAQDGYNREQTIADCGSNGKEILTKRLEEYLEDYASEDTKKKGEEVIRKELEVITNPVVREKAAQYIENIHEGKRDFRF